MAAKAEVREDPYIVALRCRRRAFVRLQHAIYQPVVTGWDGPPYSQPISNMRTPRTDPIYQAWLILELEMFNLLALSRHLHAI